MAETEILFMRRYEQKRLMQYRKRTAVVKGRGDMIVLIDESGSTRSVAGWAKALALALLDVASRDGRNLHGAFRVGRRIRTDLFEPGHYTPEDVMKAAEQFFGGGTNFEAPLKEALRLMETVMKTPILPSSPMESVLCLKYSRRSFTKKQPLVKRL